MRKTAIIVPCYNEAARLNAQAFIDEALKYPALNFIFVDDGSTDSTVGKLEALQGEHPKQMHFFSLEKNSGKAETVRRGVLRALEGDYINIGYWDADLAAPLDVVQEFCGILDSSDVTMVIGSRVRLLGRKIERTPVRHYLGRVFATFASLLLKIAIYDTQCGAKVFKKTSSIKMAFSEPFRVKWTFDVELLARLAIIERANGNPAPDDLWVEYPLKRWSDVKGSNIKPGDFIRGGIEFLKIFALLYIPVIRSGYLKRLTGDK